MPIFDTFAKRMKRVRDAGKPVIYKYDELPAQLKGQISHILFDTIGVIPQVATHAPIVTGYRTDYFRINERWKRIYSVLVKERGEFVLENKNQHESYDMQCISFLFDESDFEQVMSLVEIAFSFIDTDLRKEVGIDSQRINGAIADLNQRFQEHAVGYQYQGGKIVRMDSQYLHAETVEAAVSLLHDAGFKGPLDEFMEAHKHYREGNNKEAIVSANNAFESTMKAICDKRDLDYGKGNATAKSLIDALLGNELIPSSMQSHFTGLRTTLAGGLPTVRNTTAGAGHGQGAEPVDVPQHIVSYALHLAATNIVFLIEAHNASK